MVKKKSRTKPARAAAAPRPARPAAAPARKAPARKKTALRTAARPAGRRPSEGGARPEQPLGVGVGDAFAVARLGAGARRGARSRQNVRELSWETFGEIARALAGRIGETFRPQVVVGIAKGGVVVGGALAAALDVDFHPLRLAARGAAADGEALPELAGKRVLLVDDVCQTGRTLDRARALLRRAGAAAVRTAAVVSRPRGGRPDFSALQTDAVAVFPWDYQLHTPDLGGGEDPGEAGV
ncbi:phosphoribosyltransferase [Anaeromyxobacter paludicola]|uniref:Phosphoribosyltransferase domain-containing protein n=1 Tax=Anaeromyxobacter paludicola TaxID=2918171 RepID=A0ABM7XE77_9BACT|nr:phosphoribosyltransferase family protein [Anaeromyxobacter paludicola]BDG10167.1 hypothetical protein AMPC_32800 [Anaeromyxobacter paludicola]